MKRLVIGTALMAFVASATPAFADVKAGVEAWQRGDYPAAVAEWRDPAASGDADAQFNLAQAYKLDRGVETGLTEEQRLARAEDWYRKAAAQGHVKAADNYGLALFQNGNHAQALPWLEKSAARGEPRAEFVLGTMYFNGDGVAKDWVRAYALMSLAADGGLPQASETRAKMARYISLDDRQAGVKLAGRAEAGGGGLPAQHRSATTIADTAPAPPAKAETASAPASAPPKASAKPAPPAAKPAQPTTPQIRDGGWRVQLGAFGQPDNAKALWSALDGRIATFANRKAYFEKTGALTRLQVGPFASRAEASKACAEVEATGRPCLALRN